MTHDAREISQYGAEPVELYEFQRGADFWRYTSGRSDVTFQSKLFTAAAITRSNLDMGQEMGRANLTVTGPRDLAVAQSLRVTPPTEVMTLSVYRQHVGEGELPTDFAVVWLGRLLNAKWGEGTVEVFCEPVFTSLKRNGLRRHYQRGCPHTLYSSDCGVTQATWQVSGTCSAINANVISHSAAGGYANGYFDGGVMEWDTLGNVERRMITSHSGNDLTTNAPPINLVVGQALRIYPGCDHSLGAGGCTKFSNVINFGGWPYIPLKNPFNASIY